MTKIVCIADTQGAEFSIPLDQMPDGDILLIGGDLTCWGTMSELEEYNRWLGEIKTKYKHRVIVAGNHDVELDTDFNLGEKLFTNATYLQNSGTEIDGIKIWGSPQSVTDVPGEWAFNTKLKEQADMIPEGLDILLTHGPVYGILDQLAWNNVSKGSIELLEKIKSMKEPPKYIVHGHIHEKYGKTQLPYKDTIYMNVAMQDEVGRMFKKEDPSKLIHEPMIIEL